MLEDFLPQESSNLQDKHLVCNHVILICIPSSPSHSPFLVF